MPRSPAAPTTSASSFSRAARATSCRKRRARSPTRRAARRRSWRCSSTRTTRLLAEVVEIVSPRHRAVARRRDAGARRRDRAALRPPGDEGGCGRRRTGRAGGARLCGQRRPHPVRCQGAEDDAGALPGGNGVAFDWQALAGLEGRIDYMLAGGLDPGNVAEAILITGARAVDVSSGVESRPGEKDPDLIRRFIHAAKTAKQTS